MEYFGKNCTYLLGKWDYEDDEKENPPVLTYCKHTENKNKFEGNCNEHMCPLSKEFKENIKISIFKEKIKNIDLEIIKLRKMRDIEINKAHDKYHENYWKEKNKLEELQGQCSHKFGPWIGYGIEKRTCDICGYFEIDNVR